MSRNMRILAVLFALAVLGAGQAWAQEVAATADEIAYRAALGRADDVKILLTKGASPDAPNKEGTPILLVAAGRKDEQALPVVQALLEGGGNVNIKDKNGETALYYAARTGKPEVVDYLLKNRIDYYSLNNGGDIARTIAYRAGRNDIVDLMDDFVKKQTLQAQQTYQDAERMVADQQMYDAKQAEEAAKKRAEEEAAEAERQRIEHEKKLARYKENLKKLDQEVYDISYNACAFEYWSFCIAARQTTDLSPEEMEEIIDIHKMAVQETSMEVMRMFEVGQAYVNQVINPSKTFIYNQLSAMPSRTYRKEIGVGKLTDVHARCHKIAKSWEITEPKPNAAPPPAAAAPAPQDAQPKASFQPPAQSNPAMRKPKPYPGGLTRFENGVPITEPVPK